MTLLYVGIVLYIQMCALKTQIDQSFHLCISDQCLNCPLIQCTILKATCTMKSKIIQFINIGTYRIDEQHKNFLLLSYTMYGSI